MRQLPSLIAGFRSRSQLERVDLYTRLSLYVVFWFFLCLAALNATALIESTGAAVASVLVALALGVLGSVTLRESIRLYPAYGPVPWRYVGPLVVLTLAAAAAAFALPERAQFAGSLVAVPALAWGAGALRDRRIQVALVAASTLIPFSLTGSLGFAVYGLCVGAFLIFTVQTSLWVLEVMHELERSRQTQATLAVAEERLRFSHDVHDVLGRQLSTIAVQAELAATLAERGDARAPRYILQVRETAHEALREARDLARGYRPLDLHAEVDGAVSLLRSAGITATADLEELPEPWHEPIARVIREAVTNVLRHSTATRVDFRYAGGRVVIRNDGAVRKAEPTGTGSGTGLVGLAEQLAPTGARITTGHRDDEFVVQVDLATAPRTRHEPATRPDHPGRPQPGGQPERDDP